MAVKKGLGKGLDSLITDKVNTKPAASSNASSSNFFLGCSLFGSTFVIFIMIASAACSLFGVGLFFEAAGFVFTLSVIRESNTKE